MTDDQNKETSEKLSLSREMKSLVKQQVPESLSGEKTPKKDMISRTQSTSDPSKALDNNDD